MLLSERRKLVIQKTNFRGADVLDVRTWVETSNYKGFTKKGINLPVEKGDELVEKIVKVLKG